MPPLTELEICLIPVSTKISRLRRFSPQAKFDSIFYCDVFKSNNEQLKNKRLTQAYGFESN